MMVKNNDFLKSGVLVICCHSQIYGDALNEVATICNCSELKVNIETERKETISSHSLFKMMVAFEYQS